MFKRKIEDELYKWKESLKIKRKAFLLKGLRQVGKTSIIKHFAEKNYDNVIYIDFKLNPEFKNAFKSNLNVDNIISNISLIKPNTRFISYKTVIIFDEIQECSGARASIKAFMEDGRFDIIASGSLLGIKGYNKKINGGIPVGFEHTVYMKSMDFEEYLWAKGISEEPINYIKDCFNKRIPISQAVHNTMLKYFKEYIIIGGMPSVVNIFLMTNNYGEARNEQRDILEGYKDDFGKHLNDEENEVLDKELLIKINKVFNSIPSQLSKENKKFFYSNLEKKASSEKYGPAIEWLKDYGLIDYCFNLSALENPLEGNKISNIFKLYFADSGLFVSMLDDSAPRSIAFGDMGIYKGAIYENIVAEAFIKNGNKLYYFSKSSGLEIDFIRNIDGDITLIEVKSTNGNTKASKTVLSDKENYPNVKKLIKLGQYNIGEENNILTLPYYLTFLI